MTTLKPRGGALAASLVALAGLFALTAAPAADAAKPCGKRAIEGQTARPRIAVINLSCDEAVEVIEALYEKIVAGVKPDRHYRWHVGYYRCFTGLASTEAWCRHDESWVFSSTRPEDHPAQWSIPTEQRGPYWQHCGSQNHRGAGWYHVRAHNLHCGKARAVTRHYFHSLTPDPSPFGFNCARRTIGIELARAACRRESGGRVQQVRFIYGA